MMALGTAVGGSFFLGTGIAVHSAGPAVLVAFALGGALTFLILRARSELTVTLPAHGSFREYAERAFGPGAGFVVGWVYWTGMVLTLASEATAIALFLRLWLPALPIWAISAAVVVVTAALNLLDPHRFAAVENAMAGIKLLAIAAFIVVGLALIVGLVPGRPPVGLGALAGAPLAPGGIGAVLGSMLLVMFAYAGFEVLGLAAPDARDPARTVPRAIALTTLGFLVLYLGAYGVLLFLLPPAEASARVSPLVAALRRHGLVWAGNALNLIVMTAAFSTMLAGTYGVGRMLYSLAEEGQAPALFRRLGRGDVPRLAILASSAVALLGSVLGFVLPEYVYQFLISAGGYALLLAYLAILASQLRLRRRLGCGPAGCQMPWYPYSTWAAIAALVVILLSMPLIPGQGAGLWAGLAFTAAFAGLYLLRRPAAAREPAPWQPPGEALGAQTAPAAGGAPVALGGPDRAGKDEEN